MRPLPKNIKKTARTIAAAFLFFCGSALCGCGDGSAASPPREYEGDAAIIALELNGETPPTIDSLVISARSKADSIHIQKKTLGETVELSLKPAESWKINASLYSNKMLVEKGELELLNVQAGNAQSKTLALKAIAGYLYIQIPLGLGNPDSIKTGTLTILQNGKAKETDTLQSDGIYATLTSGVLNFDMAYSIRINLFGSGTDTLYTFDSTLTVTRADPFPALELKSLRGSASISISLDAILPSKQTRAYLRSTKRGPRKGDIIITEFMPSANISKIDSLFRFVELYNGSLDTLILTGCALAKKSSAEANSALTGKVLLPASFFIIGGDSVAFANAHDSMAKMTNIPKTLVFSCEGTVIDSLRYETSADSISITKGKSIQLPLKNWATKADWKSWCESYSPFSIQAHTFYGSPGSDAICE